MIYHWIAARVGEEGKLKLDAILGDKNAQSELDKQRIETVAESGFEVG